MPKIKLGGKKFSSLSTAPAFPALSSPAIDAQGVPVSSAPAKRKFVRNWSLGSWSASVSSTGSGNDSTSVSSSKLKMQVYVRLGIRLSYKGAMSRMEGGRGFLFSLVSYLISLLMIPFVAWRLLKSLSIKQGLKYDAPKSAADIAPFIAFHGLSVDEILEPPDSFSTSVNISSTAISNNIYNQKCSMNSSTLIYLSRFTTQSKFSQNVAYHFHVRQFVMI